MWGEEQRLQMPDNTEQQTNKRKTEDIASLIHSHLAYCLILFFFFLFKLFLAPASISEYCHYYIIVWIQIFYYVK